MAKIKQRSSFVCGECGVQSNQWQGQCHACKAWNSLQAMDLPPHTARTIRHGFSGSLSQVTSLSDVSIAQSPRFESGSGELDRALGGGFVPGSVVLLGGLPGAGKSTLLLQSICHIAHQQKTLYVSGEESLQQIAARAHRLNLAERPVAMLAETSVERTLEVAAAQKPMLIVIDSIQVMYSETVDSAPGSVVQVREAATRLTHYAKQTGAVVILVGHVTKDHTLAGPMALSHIVDTQLMLSVTDDARFRLLRASKNRFGQVNELGVFAMTEAGLKGVKNPSAIFLSRAEKPASGSIVSLLWEGTRPLLIEIQALSVDSQLNNPRRVAVGLDTNRLIMLLAILARHGNILTQDQDVFINVAGGVRVSETSADLASLLAIVSSLRDKPLCRDLVVFGEIGLSGEIRPVSNGQERLQEAIKHGFKRAIIPKGNQPKTTLTAIEVFATDHLSDVLGQSEILFD